MYYSRNADTRQWQMVTDTNANPPREGLRQEDNLPAVPSFPLASVIPPEYVSPIRGALPPSPFVPRILLFKMRGVLQGPRALSSHARGAPEGCFSACVAMTDQM